MRKLLEYGKADIWVFYKILFWVVSCCFGESQRYLFLEYFKLTINLLSSLHTPHPDKCGSKDQMTSCKV